MNHHNRLFSCQLCHFTPLTPRILSHSGAMKHCRSCEMEFNPVPRLRQGLLDYKPDIRDKVPAKRPFLYGCVHLCCVVLTFHLYLQRSASLTQINLQSPCLKALFAPCPIARVERSIPFIFLFFSLDKVLSNHQVKKMANTSPNSCNGRIGHVQIDPNKS